MTVVGHQFITPTVHICVQHGGREAPRRAGLSAAAETCLKKTTTAPAPEFAEVSGRVRHHHVDDILEHFRLVVEALDDSPLDDVVVPQVALAQQALQHVGRRRRHLHAVLPQSQRMSVADLLVRHVHVTAA